MKNKEEALVFEQFLNWDCIENIYVYRRKKNVFLLTVNKPSVPRINDYNFFLAPI